MENNYKLNISINDISTGDILLFQGKNSIFSSLVEYFTGSDYSHCGMIIKPPINFTDPPLDNDKIYFIESGIESTNQPEYPNNKILGVQLTNLNELIDNYDGDIYYRKLIWDLSETEKHIILADLHKEIHNKHYDTNPIDFIEAYLGLNLCNKQRTNNFFCSALLGYLYTNMGLLSKTTNWDLLEPKYFSNRYNSDLKLLNNAYLLPEIKLVKK